MEGKFKKFQSLVKLDTTQPALAQGSLILELNSIDTGLTEADQEVVGPAWFHVAAHPKATFTLKNLRPLKATQYELSGLLSIKGQTREIMAPATLSPQGVLQGQFTLRRADYGIGQGMWAKFDVVANEINIKFNLALQ